MVAELDALLKKLDAFYTDDSFDWPITLPYYVRARSPATVGRLAADGFVA